MYDRAWLSSEDESKILETRGGLHPPSKKGISAL